MPGALIGKKLRVPSICDRGTGSGPSFVHSATMADAEESAESVHPWPYLSEIFAYKSKAGNSVKLICLLCAPKRKEWFAFVCC